LDLKVKKNVRRFAQTRAKAQTLQVILQCIIIESARIFSMQARRTEPELIMLGRRQERRLGRKALVKNKTAETTAANARNDRNKQVKSVLTFQLPGITVPLAG